MFPEIVKNKKKPKVGTSDMIKECEQILKQIQYRHKKALKSLPNQLVSDFNKVCLLKDIRPFYSHYFFYFVQLSPKQSLEHYFAQQIQNIMLNRSYYHKIQNLIKQRTSLLNVIKQQLRTVEGFAIMNSGKNLPITLKGTINQLIKGCSSLDQVKEIETNQVIKLAQAILKVRQNLISLSQNCIAWEYNLKGFAGQNQKPSFKKTKVIFPQNGINCLFHSLFDTQFIKSSFLNQEVKFLPTEYNPFILSIESTKKTTKIFEQKLINPLSQNTNKYRLIETYIFDSIPNNINKIEDQKVIEGDKKALKSERKNGSIERTRSRERKRSDKKIIDQFLNSKLISQKNMLQEKIQSMSKIINVDKIQSVYNKKKRSKASSIYKQDGINKSLSKSKSVESLQQQIQRIRSSVALVEQRQVTVTSNSNRSRKSIEALKRPKSMSKTLNNMKKIQNVYKNSARNPDLSKLLSPRQKAQNSLEVDKILKEKQQLVRQLNKQKKEQQNLKKIIKKVQNRTVSQNKLYEQKMNNYEKQINLLKSRIRDREKKFEKSPKQAQFEKNKHNDLIKKVYQQNSPSKRSPQKNLAESQLIDEKNSNKLLQNKIKQLTKEKLKLQKLIEKEGQKVNKEKQLYERKLQKYQEMIGKLRNQANQSKRSLMESNKKLSLGNPIQSKETERNNRLQQLYTKRQTINIQKQQIIRENSPLKLNKEQKKDIKKDIKVKESQSQKIQSKDDSDLKITNSRNTIQIVYKPKKNKKSVSKQSQAINSNQTKQKQFQLEQQMSRLQKQKSLLERKLDLRQNQKSGTQQILFKKLQQSEQQLQKYKQMVEKQKSTAIRYDEKMKELRKKINQQIEQKMQRQRQRFQKQKEYLFMKLKQEKQSKIEKEKYLSRQMIFLKQMQMRQNELIQMLERQRIQRQQKQRILQEQIEKKQQLLQTYQIQQIKRIIEKQVRQQMKSIEQKNQQEQGDQVDMDLSLVQKKKQVIENEIRQMMEINQEQLRQIDEENQKLKELILKIKEEEQKVIYNIQNQIFEEQEEKNIQMNKTMRTQKNHLDTQNNELSLSKVTPQRQKTRQIQTDGQLFSTLEKQKPLQNYSQLAQQLQHKSSLQLSREKLSNSRYKALQQSPSYHERQKLENLIQHYLKNPHQYPSNQSIVMKKDEKANLIVDLVAKSKKAKEFQQQLMQLKNVQSFVPAQRDDPITAHMLNLREAYQNEEAESLRRILFPTMNENQKWDQNEHELSFESQQPPPPVTLMDHVKVHGDKYLQNKKNKEGNKKSLKNFMAINRMRLVQIQEEKKQRHRQMIEEQAKKKVKKMLFKAKKKEKKQLEEFIQIKEQLQKKEKKRQIQLEKAKKGQVKDDSKEQSKQKINNTVIQAKDKKNYKKINQSLEVKDSLDKKNEFLEKDNQTVKLKDIQEEKKKVENQSQRDQFKEKNSQHKEENQMKPIVQQNAQKLQSNQISTKKQQLQFKQQEQEQNEFLMIGQDEPLDKKQQTIAKGLGINNKQQSENKQKKNNIERIQKKDQPVSIRKWQVPKKQGQTTEVVKQKLKTEQEPDQQDQYGDEDFQDDSEQDKNQFLPHQNKDLEQLKLKLAHRDDQQSTKQNLQKEKQKSNYLPQQQQQRQQQSKLQKQQAIEPVIQLNQPSQNLPLLLLQQQRSSLLQDLLSYQQQIRSYISTYSQFQVYQHFIQQKELPSYINELLQLSSEQIVNLNNNKTLQQDVSNSECLVILVAKDKQTKLEIGIGVFHKEFQDGQYICDYILAHDMKHFLNLTFNFSRFLYQKDSYSHSTQYIFTISALEDPTSKLHFGQFQAKCKRLAQVYVKGKQSSTRKYVLKRNLFEFVNNEEALTQQKGIVIKTKLQVHQTLMKQKNQGYVNKISEMYSSPTVLFAIYLKNNIDVLEHFKASAESDLKHRETLLTAMVFHKKDFNFKNIKQTVYSTEKKLQIYKNQLGEKFSIDNVQQKLVQLPPKSFKRCILKTNQNPQSYCFMSFQQQLNRVQTQNSSQMGTFLPLVPKYKVLIIPAAQFLTSCSSNPDMNVFFYTKHFIKNISEVKKQTISRVFLPEIKVQNWTFYKNLSQKTNKTVFGKEQLQIGFESRLNNSVIYHPKHNDLVIEKPFIFCVLSANVERAIEGSPLFCKLVE